MRLGYSSEAEDTLSRLWRKQRKLEARLDDDWHKPKGMRWKTYEGIRERLDNVEEELDSAFCLHAMRLLGALVEAI